LLAAPSDVPKYHVLKIIRRRLEEKRLPSEQAEKPAL